MATHRARRSSSPAVLGVIAIMMTTTCSRRPPDDRRTGDEPLDALAAAVAAGGFPRTTSVIAAQHGVRLYERYFDGAGPDTLHDVRSVTKSLAALAVGIAIADGKLASVDQPAFAYLSDLRPFAHDGPVKAAITIADLLTMSSALDCDDDDRDSPGNEDHMYPRASWSRWAADLPVRAGYARDRDGRGPFAYCTAGVFLLGQVLQRATGQPIDRYVEDRLLAPLGIHRIEWNRSPSGEVAVSGQLRIRSADLAAVAQLILDRGRHGGAAIVPEAWIDRMLTVQRRPGAASDPRGELGYGYLMWRREYATPCGRSAGWYMSGNGGTHAIVLRDRDAIAVVTAVNYDTRGMHDQTTRLVEQHVWPRLRCP
jgi:CubicO group peptidase (beta-lactamase class C family)